MGQIFLDKYRSFEEYQQNLCTLKIHIEKQIDFYWDYVTKFIDT
jgi:hypothetical protein